MHRITHLLLVAIFISIFAGSAIVGGNRAVGARSIDGESRYAKLDGQRVHYENHGKGHEALVFVHGWTCNLSFWSRQVPAFEGKTRVIAIDLPGSAVWALGLLVGINLLFSGWSYVFLALAGRRAHETAAKR